MIAALDRPDIPLCATPARKRGGGPRTQEGKDQSRRNSLKHGLRARVLLPDDLAAAVAERTHELAGVFGPASPYEEWLVAEMARATAQLDRCAELTIADLRRCVERAERCWDDDRRKAVEDLGARLGKDPARVARALAGSKQGADWLVERWEGLADCLRTNGAWDEAQRRLAFDLLGVAPELRQGSTRVPAETDAAGLAALAARQIARLKDRLDATLDELDEATRSMAAAGMPMDEDAATARLRKYEASCRRVLLSSHSELRRVRAEFAPEGDSCRPEGSRSAEAPLSQGFSKSACDYHARRSSEHGLEVLLRKPELEAEVAAETSFALETRVEAEPSAAPVASPDRREPLIGSPVPPPPVATFKPSAAPGNRHERRTQELKARKAARRAAR